MTTITNFVFLGKPKWKSFSFYLNQEKQLASSLCEYIAGRLIRWHQNVKWISRIKLAKRSKTEKWTSPSNFTYLKLSRYQFQLKLTILNFWTKLTQKGYFQSKKENNENHHQILNMLISQGSKFSLQKFWFFETNFPKHDISVEHRKYEQHHWILHT